MDVVLNSLEFVTPLDEHQKQLPSLSQVVFLHQVVEPKVGFEFTGLHGLLYVLNFHSFHNIRYNFDRVILWKRQTGRLSIRGVIEFDVLPFILNTLLHVLSLLGPNFLMVDLSCVTGQSLADISQIDLVQRHGHHIILNECQVLNILTLIVRTRIRKVVRA